MSSGQRQESCRLFMDDIAATAETTVQTKHLLIRLIDNLKWVGLTVKLEKMLFHCQKGKITTQTIQIEGSTITSVTETPIRYLGKIYMT